MPESLFNLVAGGACNFIKKETLAQVFSCKFCEISKNTFFTEHVWATAFLLVPNQLQDSTFLFEINSENISIIKLVSQSKLLPSLFEHKDNDTIVMSTIIKKICHEIEAVYN